MPVICLQTDQGDLEVVAMKGYSSFPKTTGLDTHQMQFNVTSRTLGGGGSTLLQGRHMRLP